MKALQLHSKQMFKSIVHFIYQRLYPCKKTLILFVSHMLSYTRKARAFRKVHVTKDQKTSNIFLFGRILCRDTLLKLVDVPGSINAILIQFPLQKTAKNLVNQYFNMHIQ